LLPVVVGMTDMELFSLIIGGITGAVICFVVIANKLDDLKLTLALTKSNLAQSQRDLKKAEGKLAAIRQLLDES
jgi:hypothetical protein